MCFEFWLISYRIEFIYLYGCLRPLRDLSDWVTLVRFFLFLLICPQQGLKPTNRFYLSHTLSRLLTCCPLNAAPISNSSYMSVSMYILLFIFFTHFISLNFLHLFPFNFAYHSFGPLYYTCLFVCHHGILYIVPISVIVNACLLLLLLTFCERYSLASPSLYDRLSVACHLFVRFLVCPFMLCMY